MAGRNDRGVVRGRERPAVGPLELRVHGIGDHRRHTASGDAPVLRLSYRGEPDVLGPAGEPEHQVRKIDWSRTSRSKARMLWFAALPFTLVNVAAEMGPPADARGARTVERRVFSICVALFGVLVTISALIWGVALVETGMRLVRLPQVLGVDPSSPSFPLLTVTILLGLGTLVRVVFLRRRGAPSSILGMGALHGAAIVAVCVGVLVAPPTRWRFDEPLPPLLSPLLQVRVPVDPDETQTFLDAPWSVPSELHVDPLAASIVFTLLTGIAVALALTAVDMVRSRRTGTPSISLTAAGLACLLAVGLVHVYGSALRLGADIVLRYLNARNNAFPFVQERRGDDRIERLVMPLQASRSSIGSGLIDRVALFLLLGLLALALGVLVLHLARRPLRGGSEESASRWTVRARFQHDLVSGLPRTLRGGVILAVPLWISASALLLHLILSSAIVFELTVPLSQGLAVAAVVFVVTGGGAGRVRTVYGMIADIAGFWPVTAHPLAGRSYRQAVLDGLDQELLVGDRLRAGPTVLVGHSQGSVLCFWWVQQHPALEDLDLVLCGSPLDTLYASFFPQRFSAAHFDEVVANCRSVANFWRETDPIATELGHCGLEDVCLADPRDQTITHPRGHSDYWSDPVQMGYIAGRLNDAATRVSGG